MFHNSNNILINGGTFTSHVSTIQPNGQKGMETLQQNIAPGAFHNSDESCDPPKCHPRTRQAILAKIMEWVQTPDCERFTFFMWLYGPAGSGKSAIAHTIAEMCHEAGLLAASFFFSRNATGQNDKTRFVSTLAYQLALSIPAMREGLCMALETDPMLLTRSLEAQLLALVVQPFKSGYDEGRISPGDCPLLIIVDGLDECKDPRSQTDILTALSTTLKRYSLPFYFLLSSRPEYHIRRAFDGDSLSTLATRTVLDNNYRPDDDISCFFEDKFTELKRQHPAGAHIPPYWPNTLDGKDMVQLIQKASGQFIYASTIVKYVSSHRHWPPERLGNVLGVPPGEDDSSPFCELDAFYHHVLTAANISENKKIRNVMMLLVLRPFQSRLQTKNLIELFWGYRSGEVDMLLSDLHSIVDPQDDNSWSHNEPRISHASLSDFLLDRERSGKFYIDKGDAYTKITMRFLHHLRPSESKSLLRRLDDHIENSLVTAFMDSCMQANVTPELLEELYSMDPSVLFKYNRVPELMCWFAKHHHPSYKTDLMHHHKPTFYDWLRRRLIDLPDGMLTRCILASISLPQFIPLISTRIFSILEDALPGPQGKESAGEFFQRMRHIREYVTNSFNPSLANCPEYCSLYSQFFTDPAVAGGLFVDKADYLTLTQKVWEFICRRNYLKHDDVNAWTQDNASIPSHDDWAWVPGHNWAYLAPHPDPGDYYRFGKVALDLFSVLLVDCLQDSDAPTLVSLLKDAPPKPWGSETDSLYTEKLKAGEAITDYLEKMIHHNSS